MSEELLVLEEVRKAFGRTVALDVDRLSFMRNTYNVILGPSGAGKTTLLRIVAGLEYPDSGKVILEGKDITNLPPWQRDIGFVFQNYALYPHLTVYDNIALPLTVKGMPKDKIRERVMEVVRIMGLEEHINKYPRQLSGGQQQRVALARAVIKNPKLLLLDEPLSNLDAKVRVELRSYLKKFQRQLGITVLHVTHDQSEAMAIGDNLVIINNGRVEQVGPPAEIYNNPRTLFVANFIGTLNLLPAGLLGLDGYDYVGFRPEDVELLQKEAKGAVRATVYYVEYQGSEAFVSLSVDGAMVRVKVPATVQVQEGQEVYARVLKGYLVKGNEIKGKAEL